MNENNFTELYKTWTTDKLLDIIDSPSDYQPLAVETAQRELDRRQLSMEQLVAAKAIQAERQREKSNKQQRIKAVEDKIKSVGSLVADTFNPIQSETPTTDKYIKLISLFLGGLFLYDVYLEFGLMKFMFTEATAHWDLGTMLIFLPWIILPTASILLWYRKKHGWTLATLFFSNTAAGAIQSFIHELNRKPTGIPALDTLFPTTSPIVYIGAFLLFEGVTLAMTKENIREAYDIDKETMFLAIGLGAASVLLIPLLIA
jgi:hypothetical protein